MRVENRVGCLDYADWHISALEGDSWGEAETGGAVAVNGGRKCATGRWEKDKSLKEKTVVPVVQVGKVGNGAKWLVGRGFGLCAVF